MELRAGRVRQGHGRSWKRRAFTKNLREVGDVLFLRKVVPVWYPSIGARGRSNRRVSGIDYWTVPEPDRDRPASGLGAKAVRHRPAIDDVQHRAPLVRGVN